MFPGNDFLCNKYKQHFDFVDEFGYKEENQIGR